MGKHLCWSLVLVQNIAKFLRAPILKIIWQRTASENVFIKLRKKLFNRNFNFMLKTGFFNINIRNKRKCLFLFHDFTYLLEFIKRGSNIQEKNVVNEKHFPKTMTNEKHFPKTISLWEFDYGLFTNLLRIIVACDFFSSSFKLRRGILPLLTKCVS